MARTRTTERQQAAEIHLCSAALQASETRTRFMQLMAEPVHSTPEQFVGLIQRELKRYESVVKASGVKAD